MNAILQDAHVYRDASRRASLAAPALAWFDAARSAALQRFADRGFPLTAEEDWRYTDLREAAARSNRFLSDDAQLRTGSIPANVTAALTQAGAVTVVLLDGRYQPDLSSLPVLAGLQIHLLGQATPEQQAEIRADLETSAGVGNSALGDLNAALLRDGLIIATADGADVAGAVHVISVSSGSAVASSRIHLSLGRSSRLTVVEQHISFGAGVTNIVTEANCRAGSALRFVKVQAESDETIHLAAQVFRVESGASVKLTHLDFGAKLARNDLRIELNGAGAASDAQGLFIADGSRHLDNHTRIEHRAPHTTSRENYRGIADGSGRGVFNGKVIVQSGAAGADAQLTNQNLLLARSAEIDTKPELEIYTDDVKCSHGATTGQLDPQAIFYMRSRGIARNAAQRMLVGAFAAEIVNAVEIPAVQQWLNGLLARRLSTLGNAPGNEAAPA